MTLSLIVAASENDVIGRGGQLPWRLKNDLKRFRELTTGHTVIMGRKTYESIGRPLPHRRNIVITRDLSRKIEGCDVVHSVDEALQLVTGDFEIFIIGGGDIYRQALPRADRIHLTRVHAAIEGDAFFPELPAGEWKEVACEEHSADQDNEYPYAFLTYQRTAR